MATNQGNGVINNGNMPDQREGLGPALSQSTYRMQYNQRMFANDGYLQESIRGLQEQIKQIDLILEKSTKASKASEKLNKTEIKRYNTLKSELDKLSKQQQEMYDRQEASSDQLNKSITKANNARVKAIDQMYKHFHSKQQQLNEDSKKELENKLKELAHQAEHIDTTTAELNKATKNLEKAQKSVSQGLSEQIDKFRRFTTDLTNLMNINALANSQWLEKAKERDEIINKMSLSLGYKTDESLSAYGTMIGAIQDLNESVGGSLFSKGDMHNFIQSATKLGITNENLMKDQLRQNIIATKAFGITNDSLGSIYRYMKITNNNDMLNNYNKQIIALNKNQLSVSSDMLNEMMKNGQDVTEILAASGVDIEEYLKGRNEKVSALVSSGMDEYTANQLVGQVENVIRDLYNGDYERVYANGINGWEFGNAARTGDFETLYNMVVSGRESMRAQNKGFNTHLIPYGAYNRATFQNPEDLNSIAAANNLNNQQSLMQERIKQANKDAGNITSKEFLDKLKETFHVDDMVKMTNWAELAEAQFLGGNDGWLSYSGLAKVFFGLAIGSSIFQVLGGLGGLFGKFFGKGSILGKGAEGAIVGGKQLSLFNAGKGAAGGALSSIAAVGGGIALGLGAANVIAAGIESASRSEVQSEMSQERENLVGTKLEGNKMAEALGGVASARSDNNSNFASKFGSAWSTTTKGIGIGLLGWTRDTKQINQDDWQLLNNKLEMVKGSKEDKAIPTAAWTLLLYSAGRQNDIEELSGFSKEHIKKYLDSFGYSKETWDWYVANKLKDAVGVLPNKNQKEDQTYIDWDKLNIAGYHLAGLERVPKDNYKALLHKDEMVLNKKQADSVRNVMEKNVGGESDDLYKKQMKIVMGDLVPSRTGVESYGAKMGLPKGWTLTAGYGTYTNMTDDSGRVKIHRGIDIAAASGTEIRAAHSGIYKPSSSERGYGNTVRIDTGTGLFNRYGHLSRFNPSLKDGDKVNRGQLIGYVGSTGNSTGPHLHFQVNKSNNETDDINPWPYVQMEIFGGTGNLGLGDTGDSGDSGEAASAGSRLKIASSTTYSKRALPGMGGAEKNVGGKSVDRIVNSVDGVSSKIINYLDEIRQEQADQRRLINAFSMSQSNIEDYR